MKKILLSLILITASIFAKRTDAQCGGATITVSNFTVNPTTSTITYSFNWEYVNGNASLQVVFLCNGVEIPGTAVCIPTLKNYEGLGAQTTSGSLTRTCVGIFKVELRIWTNNSCGGNSCVQASREIALSPLPVDMKSFTATRNKSNVLLNWTTSSEKNNSGFAVERNIAGNWEEVAFVNSQAQGGNSSMDLNYQYNDLNTTKGVTQYRIRQVDFDSRSKYSEIRSVKGEGQIGKIIVYPNPTADGRVNIVFDDATVTRSIMVSDMSGRTVKQINGITNNNITIENLMPGIYSLRVFVPETGEQAVQKIVVNKR